MQQYILHVDGDSFFAACEIARFPHLKGKPVVVGEDRGIACAMSYEAKKLGITRGMPIFKIRDQFPSVVILSSHFELYEQYANKLFSLLQSEIDTVERYSIDECFGLVSFPHHYTDTAIILWLQTLKKNIQDTIGITYSFGLARTKVLAKVASKYKKPDGCTVLFPKDEKEVLKQTPIESIWGIGWSLSQRFQLLRLKTAYEFALWDEERVGRLFTLPVQELWHELNGREMFSLTNTPRQPKSLQSTKSFSISTDKRLVIAELLQNMDIVFSRMRQYGLVTKAISFYLKTSERRYKSDVVSLPYYSDNPLDAAEKIAAATALLFQRGVKYRSTGVSVWGLRPKDSIEYDFFGYQKEIMEKTKIAKTIDTIRSQFGYESIGILSVLPSTKQRQEKFEQKLRSDTFIPGLPLPYLGEVT